MSASTHLISAANKVLRVRTDDQWLEMLAALPESIRDGVGRLVWWDWLSHRTVADRNPAFDQYLKFSTREYEDKEQPQPITGGSHSGSPTERREPNDS